MDVIYNFNLNQPPEAKSPSISLLSSLLQSIPVAADPDPQQRPDYTGVQDVDAA